MNWLAHLLLSEPAPEFRIGNLLPDLVRMNSLAHVPPAFQRGMACHRRIDAFTDAHPVFRRSVARFPAPYRRFGGVLTDVFYDHFLAVAWEQYASQSLAAFAQEIYASFDDHRAALPSEAWTRLDSIRAGRLLTSYHTRHGVREALQRIGQRLRRPFDLGGAAALLETHDAEFRNDFAEFFPQLQRFVAGQSL